MKRDQFTFYRSYYEALKNLTKRDQTTVLMAVIGYALDETEPNLSGVPLSVFTLIRPTVDSGRKKAENRANKTRTKQEQNNNKPESKEEQISKENEGEREEEREIERENDSYYPPTPLPGKFHPPSVEEVRAYCQERKNGVDPQSFVDHYSARGWKYNGNVAMKDWKAAVRTWEKNRREGGRDDYWN